MKCRRFLPAIAAALCLSAGIAIVSASRMQAQSPIASKLFDVASVKPQPWNGQGSVGVFVRGNTLDAEHVSLFDLVKFAYNLRDVQLSGGPFWVRSGVLASSELFQVIAKAPEGPPPPRDVFRQMLQALLAERFKLRVHHAQKELPVYNLAVRKGGPRLTVSPADATFNFVTSAVGKFGTRIAATHMTVQQLIEHQLEVYAGRPTFDGTGLTAAYDFTLEFTRDMSVGNISPADQADYSDLPSLGAALEEQLGLKLEPGSAPFDTVAIDYAEKPSAN